MSLRGAVATKQSLDYPYERLLRYARNDRKECLVCLWNAFAIAVARKLMSKVYYIVHNLSTDFIFVVYKL